MECFINVASVHAKEIKQARANDRANLAHRREFPLDWAVDTTHCDSVIFKGYTSGHKASGVSGLPRLYYDREKPFTKKVPFYDHFVPTHTVSAPQAYIIPKTWVQVISCLRSNGVHITRLTEDTTLTVTAYHIDNYNTGTHPYEKHYLHKNVQVSASKVKMRFSEGDYYISLDQPAKRYLIETLEPTAPDAFFAWNFFDGILQQKEYFSDYVFEDTAAQLLEKTPALQAKLIERRNTDPEFAKSAAAQLDFVYRNSAYFEQSANRYPVYRVE
jgi:hypothetical protein